jgi:hypothetical protein
MSANPNRAKFLKKDSTIFMGALNEYRTEAKKKDTEKAKIVEVRINKQFRNICGLILLLIVGV